MWGHIEMEEMEGLLEKIWDLHDKLSDAILTISKSHFLNSIKFFYPTPIPKPSPSSSSGYVFVKDFPSEDDAAIAEARSLNCIRTALENLEDQHHFLHTVQSLQKAERDAAMAQLEQSRIVLAMRLADHHGKSYKVIEEALAFVGDVHDASHFVSPRNSFETQPTLSNGKFEDDEGKKVECSDAKVFSSFTFAKKSLKLESIGAVLGNAAFFAVSMLAFLQLHQAAFKSDFVLEVPQLQEDSCYMQGYERNSYQFGGSSSSSRVKHLDVFSARG